MGSQTNPNSKSRFSLVSHSTDSPARKIPSRAVKWIRGALVTITLICVWLSVRFPYEVESGLEHWLNGPDRVNPQTLHLEGEFVESNLGAVEESGDVVVRMIAEQYLFVPQCVVVPAGVPVRLRITSADVVHKPTVENVAELKAVPGYVVEHHLQFPKPGQYQMPCREFCGPGHYAMRSFLTAVPLDQFRSLNREARMSCATR